jgi:hypothetical protein
MQWTMEEIEKPYPAFARHIKNSGAIDVHFGETKLWLNFQHPYHLTTVFCYQDFDVYEYIYSRRFTKESVPLRITPEATILMQEDGGAAAGCTGIVFCLIFIAALFLLYYFFKIH